MTGMDTLHLVDPDLRPLLAAFPTVTLDHTTLADLRNRKLPIPPAETPGIGATERFVPGPVGAPEVAVRIYAPLEPGPAPRGCIFHIHGGGYVGGSAREAEFLIRPLAQDLDCVIVSTDYRLAPEAVFPAAIEDCYAALAWTFANAGALGIDPARIGVMGESAGGGLAASLALLARDRGEFALAFQHLTYPMLDDRTCVRPANPVTGQFVWPAHNNRFGWSALLGREPGADGVSPYAAAARAEDLAGLPPTYVMTGALDLFLDEDIAFAHRLIAAGVTTELQVYPGAFHGFDLVPGLPITERARADRIVALRRALA